MPTPILTHEDDFPSWLSGITLEMSQLRVTISNPVLKMAQAWARMRVLRNDEQGRKPSNQSDIPNVERHFLGFCGEIAFGALIRIPPDFSTIPREGGPDFVLSGITVDVKTSPGYNMNVEGHKRYEPFACQLYVAMAGPFEHPDHDGRVMYSYAGHAPYKFVFDPKWTKPGIKNPKKLYQAVPLGKLSKRFDRIQSISGG